MWWCSAVCLILASLNKISLQNQSNMTVTSLIIKEMAVLIGNQDLKFKNKMSHHTVDWSHGLL